ncbi:MAG: hypothetical protein ABJ246_17385 [Paracoccaceae bacterium]
MNGSIPLSNQRHEAFCVSRASGASLEDAWRQSSHDPKMQGNVARSNGWRAERYPKVVARIAFLRHKIASERPTGAGADLASKDPAMIMEAVSDVLQATYEAAQRLGVPEQKLAMIRKAWSNHTARFAKIESQPVPEIAKEPNQFWQNIRVCSCG